MNFLYLINIPKIQRKKTNAILYHWDFGYSKSLSLVYIDYYNNQKRILKDSAKFFKKVIEENRVVK